MKKIANGDGEIIVGMKIAEFERITGVPHESVSLGTNISLASIKNKLDLIDAKQAELLELKTAASTVVAKLNAIGI